MEEMLKVFEKAINDGASEATLQNLATKSSILRDRSASSESVIRELMNGRVYQ
jgi:hypothetical protein